MIEHDKHYYDECAPVISDFAYDQKMHELLGAEKEHPEWALPSLRPSGSARVRRRAWSKETHLVPMLSLANTYSEEELGDFVRRVHKLLEKEEVDFCCELKMDGTAISLL